MREKMKQELVKKKLMEWIFRAFIIEKIRQFKFIFKNFSQNRVLCNSGLFDHSVEKSRFDYKIVRQNSDYYRANQLQPTYTVSCPF